MSEPRKHHYLPQFYLRGFSADGKSVCQIEKQTLRSYMCSIRDAAAIRDYHELDNPNFKDTNALEKRLAAIEGQLATAVSCAIEAGITTTELHEQLMEFVSVMRIRVPAFKAYIEESLRQAVRSTGLIMERAAKLPAPPKGLEDVLSMENISIDISNWKCLEFMFGLASNEQILNLLRSMHASTLRAPHDAAFLTCDQPVAVYHPTAMPNDAYGVGLQDLSVEISIPLSMNTLLHLTWLENATTERLLRVEDVAEFNRRTVVMADSLVFTPEKLDWALETVSRYSQFSAGIDLSVMDAGREFLQLSRFRPVMAANKYELRR